MATKLTYVVSNPTPRRRQCVFGTTISPNSGPGVRCRGRLWRTRAVELDPDLLLPIAGAVMGVGVGIVIPIFLISRDDIDEERVEALRDLNKETFEATGEYLNKEELSNLRAPRWTDKREFKDDD